MAKTPQQIVELLNTVPSLSSNEIATRLNAKITSVKVTLNKMVKTNRLMREKVERAQPSASGPKRIYAYKVAEVKSDIPTPQA